MCGLEEVKRMVAVLPLGQALKELLSIASHELSSQFDSVHIDVCQSSRMTLCKLELISWWRFDHLLVSHEVSFARICGIALQDRIVSSTYSEDLFS